MGGRRCPAHVVVAVGSGNGGGGRPLGMHPGAAIQAAVEVVGVVGNVGALQVVLRPAAHHPAVVVVALHRPQPLIGAAQHLHPAGRGKPIQHLAVANRLVGDPRYGIVVKVMDGMVLHDGEGDRLAGRGVARARGAIIAPALPQHRLHVQRGLQLLTGVVAPVEPGDDGAPEGVVLAEKPAPLAGEHRIAAVHHLVKPVVHHLLPPPAGHLLLDQPFPCIVMVAVDELVENRLRLLEATDVLAVLVDRRGKHVAEVAKVVVHIVRTQAFCAGLPGPLQHYPAIKVPVLFGSAGIPIGGLPVLVPDGRFIEPAGLVVAGSGPVAGAVDAPQLHLVRRIGAVGRTDRMVVGSPGRGLPCRAREALLHHTVQGAGLEHRNAEGAHVLHDPLRRRGIKGQLVGYRRGPVAPAGTAAGSIGKVLHRLPAQRIVGNGGNDVRIRGAGPDLDGLKRTAQAIKILDGPVLLAQRPGIVQVLCTYTGDPERAGKDVVLASTGNRCQWTACLGNYKDT